MTLFLNAQARSTTYRKQKLLRAAHRRLANILFIQNSRHVEPMDIKKIILWIGLAIVSYMMVLAWNNDYHQAPQAPVAEQAAPATDNVQEQNTGNTQNASDTNGEFATPEDTGDKPVSVDDTGVPTKSGSTEKPVIIRTDVLELAIDPVGGNIIRAALLKYKDSLGDPAPLELLQKTRARTYMMESSLIGQDGFDASRNGKIPTYSTTKDQYKLKQDAKTLTVDFTTKRNGISVTKRYTLSRDSYEIDVHYLINNQSDKAWKANFAGKIVRDESGDPTAQRSLGIHSYLGMVLSTPNETYEKYDFDDMQEEPVNVTVKGGWIAFLQHYFLSAWIPGDDSQHQYQTTQRNNLTVMGFVSPATVVDPGSEAEVGARAYIGPKVIDRLEAVAPNLDRTVDFGFLFFIALPLFFILDWFHSLVGNWGVAIILLTVTVKAVFYKLSATSYRSMARMRAVAPELKQLRENYGDDRQRMSQEMMALYKRKKINPLGGCLPILVQMPVFISLYWTIFESVQLRHAPFFLWINDLSVMDPYFILPILMGISMFIQMSLNPTPPDPMQAKIMKLMPVVFTVFFLWFPAGLVLYWLSNNILSITQQYYITRKIEAESNVKKA